ncbi:GyrI-like domain-containing protein [Homoserinibacter sp. YIM 151385]|uniref:GyrI-like domain-containing protein n=1 Tax=Homoserinibacter sp. YIM 151385 TaxID=2985506 RepID=UPI0022F023F5|nr:GyrI-like domain-containing protein [Homoserinibacter sp. YIM 151385]WBU36697.1 GyrI-like domain-containing protein [Homoserinibacter sp. YIM 151385]
MSAAGPLDLRREIAAYRAPRGRFELVEVPELSYLMVDGHGDPNADPSFTASLEALHPLAYRLRFASRALGRDARVMPLEGLWWADDMASFTSARDKRDWDWTLMIAVPPWIDASMLEDAASGIEAKATRAKPAPTRLRDVRLERLAEGLCVQTLHVGPFDEEAETLRRMHEEFVPAERLRVTGRHHEVYLSDRRRTAPEKLRTILRQPVERVDSGDR